MIEFINACGHTVVLTGPNKETIQFIKNERKVLNEWYKRYVPRYLRITKMSQGMAIPPPSKPFIRALPVRTTVNVMATPHNIPRIQARAVTRPLKKPITQVKIGAQPRSGAQFGAKPVGHASMMGHQASAYFRDVLNRLVIPISNDIGVGILSYNRLGSTRRLIESIRKFTDLKKTTVFISDESSDQAVKSSLNGIKDMVVLDNKMRLGVAGNTNRLMRCLERFRYKILLNDDVEILASGWEHLYPNAIEKTNIHHFCMRQIGVLRANGGEGRSSEVNGIKIWTINEKPHGAVIAYDVTASKTVGYFDEQFGIYGMEHVDWSNRIALSGVQTQGYHDVLGSDQYFKIHAEASKVEEKGRHLAEARTRFDEVKGDKTRIYVNPSPKSEVDRMTCVVPFRGLDRCNAVRVVLQNLKALKFPQLEIIFVEQDSKTNIRLKEFDSIKYALATMAEGIPFAKAYAFNVGVSKSTTDKLILHDADMLVQDDYATIMYKLLNRYDAVHIGKTVVYFNHDSTNKIAVNENLDSSLVSERSVGYYEGGSLGIRYNTYIDIGGFCEEFVGYGCFAPDRNFVLTKNGYKQINEVRSDDLVYTHNGRFKPIELRVRQYSGELLKIFVPGRLPINGVTPEHPFLVSCQDGTGEWKWKKANELGIGDEILDTDFMPELVPSYDLLDVAHLDNSKNKFVLSDHLSEFAYLLGLYLAEGVLQSPDRLRTIYYFINKEETFLVEHIKELVSELNNQINVSSEYVKNNCRDVRVFSSLLAKLIYAVAGKFTAKNKVLSYNFAKQLDNDNIAHLLGGMLDGDGNHGTGSEHRLVYHTSSINLAMIASGMMRRLGIAHSFGIRKQPSGFSDFNSYDLTINREFERRIKLIYPRKPYYGSNSTGKSMFGKVYDISRISYDGPVYNFEVEEDHSYIVNGMVVHNCEDCEFFNRLLHNTSFFNERSIDLFHLWHTRTLGWDQHHQKNKVIGNKIMGTPMQQRLKVLCAQLHHKYSMVKR